MSYMEIRTGDEAQVVGAPWTEDLFGYRYNGFRSFARFDAQLADNHVGMLAWPGGYLGEFLTDRYGLQFDGLLNPDVRGPGLAQMLAHARAEGVGLAVLMPTARYLGHDAELRADVRHFMSDLLSGHYGPLPERLILEIGSEYYASFPGGPDEASNYGHVASIYVEEMSAALNDPAVNILGYDPAIAVQAGRTLADDQDIRNEFQGDSLAEVDQVIHHRFALNATGVDRTADELHVVMEAWRADIAALGGEGPDLLMSGYNVGSYSREEALDDFLATDHAHGGHLTAADVDMGGRSTVAFEEFWQDQLTLRDYGGEHPRVLLEMLSEYNAEGMTAAHVFGTDVIYPGRLTLTDIHGVAQDFVGQDMLDMLGESVVGTRMLQVNLQNDRADEVWAYGFENDDRLVIFLSADSTPPEGVTLRLNGLGETYGQVAVDSLHAEVPEDWRERFGIPDNPNVDETPEAQSYAIGVRTGLTPVLDGDGIRVAFSSPNEVIRLSFARTELGAQQIEAYSDGQLFELTHIHEEPDLPDTVLPSLPAVEEEPDAGPDDVPHADAPDEGPDGGDGGGMGGIALAILPFLFLLGGGF